MAILYSTPESLSEMFKNSSLHFERALSLRNGSHFPTTQCARADFEDFATQRNGGGSREKDLYSKPFLE
jgi:hypothetical protein